MRNFKFFLGAFVFAVATNSFAKEKVLDKVKRKPNNLVGKSLACQGSTTVNDAEQNDMSFKVGEGTDGQVSPDKKIVEVKINSESRAEVLLSGQKVYIEASHNPLDGNYDIDLYDKNVLVPGDSKPLVFRTGSSVGEETSSIRFMYSQWGNAVKELGGKRKEVLFDFKCTVSDWPQRKF